MTRTTQAAAPKTAAPAARQAALSPGTKPQPQTMGNLAQLQSYFGNQGMLRLIYGGFLQPKLTINQPGDIYEQEADRMADVVMRMRKPAVAKPTIAPVSGVPSLRRCLCG